MAGQIAIKIKVPWLIYCPCCVRDPLVKAAPLLLYGAQVNVKLSASQRSPVLGDLMQVRWWLVAGAHLCLCSSALRYQGNRPYIKA